MVDDYQQEYVKFLAEVQRIDDATEAKFERLDLGSNVVLISGQIIGNDTYEGIIQIGEKHCLQVLAQKLSIMKR